MGNINKLIDEGLKDGADVICFFDEDVSQWNPEEGRQIKELHRKYDSDDRITLACSMPSIGSCSTTRKPTAICVLQPMQSTHCISTLPSLTRRKTS